MNSINYKTIDEYLADLPNDEKQSLQRLKDIIHSTVPNCKVRIAYKICVFFANKDLVGFEQVLLTKIYFFYSFLSLGNL